MGLLWLVRPEQADPLHISGTREEVANILLQNKQALQQLLWLQHQSPIGHFSGYYGYSINLPLVWGHIELHPWEELRTHCLRTCNHTQKKTVNRIATYTFVDTRTFFFVFASALDNACTQHSNCVTTPPPYLGDGSRNVAHIQADVFVLP